MNIVIFVGGATACGKSTFANVLNNYIESSRKYRRYQGFFDIAKKRGIPKEQIFNQIESSDVDNHFVNICNESPIVISDVHYAVQMNRKDTDEEIDIYQEYVPTISKELIEKLLLADIKIITIFLSCSPEECLVRAINRYNNHEKNLRTKSLVDAQLENLAEEREWGNIVTLSNVNGIKLNSELHSPEELASQCLDYLNNLLNEKEEYMILKKLNSNNRLKKNE